ncbi:hypothetical protein [Vibrio anguillarum]|uniref:hypothetical protein n=3 Tax=Vibrio anguillarum TaxID=55601 RepID=UPI00188D2366|nr:hypothetical protein [Vibrio anguillarum]MBF4337200.1 hypothetical protein [Vibrio anguillarum]
MKLVLEASSVEKLKELGEISEIIQKVNKEISPLQVVADSYQDLFLSLQKLRENWAPFKPGYFLTERKQYIYFLLECDGEKREHLLGINDETYSDEKAANRWYKKISHKIRADLNDSEEAKLAFQKLQEIYSDLIDDDAFGDDHG